jgi:hypothetical protein
VNKDSDVCKMMHKIGRLLDRLEGRMTARAAMRKAKRRMVRTTHRAPVQTPRAARTPGLLPWQR